MEESGRVRDECRALGHNAISVDLEPCSADPEFHIQGDALEYLKKPFDMVIAFPPCTYNANSGVQHLHTDPDRWQLLKDGVRLFQACLNANSPRVIVENPTPHKYAAQRIGVEYSQAIEPWMFGHPETKRTCLWLKGVKPLVPTDDVSEEMALLSIAERQRIFYMAPGPDRQMLRSRTFPGIAKAMATQWCDAPLVQNLTHNLQLFDSDLYG